MMMNQSTASPSMMIENPLLRNLRTPLASIQPPLAPPTSASASPSSSFLYQNRDATTNTTTPKSVRSTTSSLFPFSPFSPPPPSLYQLRKNHDAILPPQLSSRQLYDSHNNVDLTNVSNDKDDDDDDDNHLLASLFQRHPESLGLRQRRVNISTTFAEEKKNDDENWMNRRNHQQNQMHHSTLNGDSSKKKKFVKHVNYDLPPASKTSSSYSLGNVPTLLPFVVPTNQSQHQQHQPHPPSQYRYQTGVIAAKTDSTVGQSTTPTTTSAVTNMDVTATKSDNASRTKPLSMSNLSQPNCISTVAERESPVQLTENDILLFSDEPVRTITTNITKKKNGSTSIPTDPNRTNEHDILLVTTPIASMTNTSRSSRWEEEEAMEQMTTSMSVCERMVRYLFAMDE
jgi:hypothetical protein